VTRESANNFPMLEVPGWLENHKLPNAVAVVMALNMTSEASRLISTVMAGTAHADTNSVAAKPAIAAFHQHEIALRSAHIMGGTAIAGLLKRLLVHV